MAFTQYGRRELLLIGFVIPLAGIGAAAAGGLLLHPAVWAAAAPFALLCLFNLNFFRDPRRVIPGDEFTVVSPADGTVTDVGRRDESQYFKAEVQSVGIFLSVFDVHINRAPLEGTVDYLRHQDGAYHDARSVESSTLNEAQNIGFVSRLGPRFLVRQITGLIARRIVCPLKTGDSVQRGAKFGRLKFGSRTELYFDDRFEVDWKVAKGDKVKGGSSVLAIVKVREALASPADEAKSKALA